MEYEVLYIKMSDIIQTNQYVYRHFTSPSFIFLLISPTRYFLPLIYDAYLVRTPSTNSMRLLVVVTHLR